jgi:hypothetical protein
MLFQSELRDLCSGRDQVFGAGAFECLGAVPEFASLPVGRGRGVGRAGLGCVG